MASPNKRMIQMNKYIKVIFEIKKRVHTKGGVESEVIRVFEGEESVQEARAFYDEMVKSFPNESFSLFWEASGYVE